jgi:hypothetical protein
LSKTKILNAKAKKKLNQPEFAKILKKKLTQEICLYKTEKKPNLLELVRMRKKKLAEEALLKKTQESSQKTEKKPNLLELVRMRKKKLAEEALLKKAQENFQKTEKKFVKLKKTPALRLYTTTNKFIFYNLNSFKNFFLTKNQININVRFNLPQITKIINFTNNKTLLSSQFLIFLTHKSISRFKSFTVYKTKRLNSFLKNKIKQTTQVNKKRTRRLSFNFYNSGLNSSKFFIKKLVLNILKYKFNDKKILKNVSILLSSKKALKRFLKLNNHLKNLLTLTQPNFFKKHINIEVAANFFLKTSCLPKIQFSTKDTTTPVVRNFVNKKKYIKKLIQRLRKVRSIFKSKFTNFRRKKTIMFSRKFVRFGKKN